MVVALSTGRTVHLLKPNLQDLTIDELKELKEKLKEAIDRSKKLLSLVELSITE